MRISLRILILLLVVICLSTPARAIILNPTDSQNLTITPQQIKNLPSAAVPLTGTESVPILQNNGVFRTTISQIWAFFSATIWPVANGGTGLSTLGAPSTCLQVNGGGTALTYGACGTGGGSSVPANAIIQEDGQPILTEGGQYIVGE